MAGAGSLPAVEAGASARPSMAATIARVAKMLCSIRVAKRRRYVPFSFTPRGRGAGSAATELLDVCETAAVAAGFRRLEMGATLTGVPLYVARGYREGERRQVPLQPGLSLAIVHMEKQL